METLPLSPHFFKEVFIPFFQKSLFLATASPSPPPHTLLPAQVFPDKQPPPGTPRAPQELWNHPSAGDLVWARAAQIQGPDAQGSLDLCSNPLRLWNVGMLKSAQVFQKILGESKIPSLWNDCPCSTLCDSTALGSQRNISFPAIGINQEVTLTQSRK